jgi:hypothetical protein
MTRLPPALYFLLVSGLLFAGFHGWAYDDPFITYRYAANLHAGNRLVYNPGEPVLSTTAPLFAILLAGLRFISPNTPAAANLLGAAGMAAGGLALAGIFRRLRLPFGAAAALLLYPACALIVITLGSEMPLFLALCLAACLAHLDGRARLTGLLLGLAALMRGDALILAALIFADSLLRRDGRGLRAGLLCFAGTLLPWVIAAQWVYGSPLPVTLAAKRAQGWLAGAESYALGLWRLARGLAGFPHYWLLGALGLAGCWLLPRCRRGWFLPAWALAHGAAYTALGVTRYFWYYAPLLPGMLFGVGLALGYLAAPRKESAPHGGGATPWAVDAFRQRGGRSLLVLLLLAALFAGQVGDLARLHRSPDTRYPIFRAVGEWLAGHVPAGAAVATLEPGIMGYFALEPVFVDFAGLLRPEVARQFQPGADFDDAAMWTAAAYAPEFLVLQDGSLPGLEAGYARAHCAPVRIFRGADYAFAQDLIIYQCETPD